MWTHVQTAVRQCVLKCADFSGWLGPVSSAALINIYQFGCSDTCWEGGQRGRGERDGRGELTVEGVTQWGGGSQAQQKGRETWPQTPQCGSRGGSGCRQDWEMRCLLRSDVGLTGRVQAKPLCPVTSELL